MSTAYRFTNARFENHITPERIERIAQISPSDHTLSPEQIRRQKTNVDVEFSMSHSSQLDEAWTHRHIAVAEYLDTSSELSARLNSLQFFTALCESQNAKSSRDLLPDADAEIGLYVLPPVG